MQFVRPVFAPHSKLFGRGPSRVAAEVAESGPSLSADLKLFATTFAAGFLFVSILIG